MDKLIRKIVFAVMVGSPVPFAWGSGIPVVDGAQIGNQVAEYTKEALRWTETAAQYKQDYEAQMQQLAAQIGVSVDVAKFAEDAQKYYARVKDIQKLIDNPQQIFKQGFDALTPELKAIYEEQGFGEMCERISKREYKSEDMHKNIVAEQKRCEGELIISALRQENNERALKNVNERVKKIEKIAAKAAGAQTAKEAQDFGNQLQTQIALLNADKIQMDIERGNRELLKENAENEREKRIQKNLWQIAH